jgi:hypothetical protein
MFENFRRSLGRAGMCCSQPVRVDHMYKNMWAGGRRIFWQQVHQILQILWVMNCSGGKFTITYNNYEFYQNYCGL